MMKDGHNISQRSIEDDLKSQKIRDGKNMNHKMKFAVTKSFNYSCLEEIDSYSKVTAILL